LIHPRQVAGANEVFAPAASEVDWARRVIAAHTDALARGRGVTVLDGRLIENLHVDDARRVLALADAIPERPKAGALEHTAGNQGGSGHDRHARSLEASRAHRRVARTDQGTAHPA